MANEPASKGIQKVLVSLEQHKRKSVFSKEKTVCGKLLLTHYYSSYTSVVMVRIECEHAEICVCFKDRIECDNLSQNSKAYAKYTASRYVTEAYRD
jgi:hypothetical protein